MRGARKPPILPVMEQAPTPTLRYSLGNISDAYTNIMLKAAAAPNLPTRLNPTMAPTCVSADRTCEYDGFEPIKRAVVIHRSYFEEEKSANKT